MKDIYLVSYQRSDGELIFASVESHCRIAAINDAVNSELRNGHEIICGVAEIMCPAALLAAK